MSHCKGERGSDASDTSGGKWRGKAGGRRHSRPRQTLSLLDRRAARRARRRLSALASKKREANCLFMEIATFILISKNRRSDKATCPGSDELTEGLLFNVSRIRYERQLHRTLE
ncbi:hypothetical protein EVAR_33070_1 [Eumeta japonica]|uniref:Uncharacterized protein n=1 Tax=Eumeta variegata TaxID=151549 RepID=A0A4C1WTI8_EUMVA|nr:hypothetical protein EVAR_33070_1 [Eumeta japonica]